MRLGAHKRHHEAGEIAIMDSAAFFARYPPDADSILAAARSLSGEGRLDEAYRMLVDGERQYPGVAAMLVLRARVARDAGRRDEAADLLYTARQRFPTDDEAIIETGWLAHIARDWPTAVHWWEIVRARTPQHVVGFINGAIALREQGSYDKAEALLTSAIERFPNQASPWIDYAMCAQARKDWTESAARWKEVRERFSTVPDSYLGAAQALREQGKFTESQQVLDDAAERWPDDVRIRNEHCWNAHIARDWPEAARRWEALRSQNPALLVGWTSGALALRELRRYDEADRLLRQAQVRFPHERAAWAEYAWLASARRDWPEAVRRWSDVRSRYPAFPEGYLRGALASTENWDFEAAEGLLREGMERFKLDATFPIEYAAIALRLNRMDEAVARYAELRKNFPGSVEGYLGGALALRNGFHLREAEGALEQAFPLFPDEPRLWLEHAQLPVFAPLRRDRRPEEALSRLEQVRERFPQVLRGYIAAIRVLVDEKRLDEAETLATTAVKKFPTSGEAAVEHANVAASKGDWGQALNRYDALLKAFPNEAGGPIGKAKALAATGRTQEAEQILREVIQKFPDIAAAYTAYAEFSMNRNDWPEALQRWQAAAARFPDDKAFVQRIFDVKLHLTGEVGEPLGATAASVPITAGDTKGRLRDLVMRFESLGGRGIGCEFGMFQREFGAEPLGLLRWADMPYEGIIQTLEERFAGVGDPDNTEVFVNRENGRAEYCTRDLRGFMFMRAFVYEDEMPIDRMRKQALRRLKFLKDKLIGDLESGSKIFVWRCTERNLSDDEIHRLHAAVRSYGNNTLLYVRYEEDGRPNGTVQLREPGLMIGYIDRFKQAVDGTLSSAPATASWTTLCERAHGMFVEGTGQ
jgi:tetratricopeptide (TPR) repeat protein